MRDGPRLHKKKGSELLASPADTTEVVRGQGQCSSYHLHHPLPGSPSPPRSLELRLQRASQPKKTHGTDSLAFHSLVGVPPAGSPE